MKLSGAQATRFFARPDADRAGALIYGADAMRVALRRQEFIATLLGPAGEAEMRLTRISGGDLRRDPAEVTDAIRAQGFFPGLRVVFVEDAGDAAAPALTAALQDWRPGDAVLVVTAGSLGKASALKRVFEDHANAVSIALYDDPPSRDEVEAILKQAGLGDPGREAMGDLMALALALDPGDFRQTAEKIALYKLGDPAPLSPSEIAALAPATVEADVEEVLNAAAESRAGDVGLLMRRLEGQGVQPTRVCIDATRHFRALHAAAADPGGPGAGIARLRPPVFGPRRDRMLKQAQALGLRHIETALGILIDTDLALRSTAKMPAMALTERALIRIATLARR